MAPLRSKGRDFGDISITLVGESLVDIDGKVFIQRLPLNSKTKTVLTQMITPSGVIVLSDLELLGFELNFDASSLSVWVSIPLERMSLQQLQYRGGVEQDGDVDAGLIDDYSFYTNFRYGQSYSESGDVNAESIVSKSASIDSALSVSDWVLEAGATYNNFGFSADSKSWRKGDARLSHDFKNARTRFMVGDLIYPVTGFQRFNSMAGVSLSKNKYLDPYRVSQPTGHQSFQLEQASNIEILVNGRLVRRLYLQRGNYQIQDLPGVIGINDVVIRILGATGEVTEFDYSFIFNQQLLPDKDHDFSYNLGVFKNPYLAGNSYSEDPIFTGFHRYGFTANITAGFNAQITERQQLLGFQGQLSTTYGSLSYDYGLSHFDVSLPAEDAAKLSVNQEQTNTSAANVSHAYRIQYQYERYQFGSVSASWQYSSPYFIAPSFSIEQSYYNPTKSQWIASYSRIFDRRWLVNISRRGLQNRSDEFSNLWWDIHVSTRLFKFLSVGLQLSELSRGETGKEYEGVLTLSWQNYGTPNVYDARYESASKSSSFNYQNSSYSGSHSFKTLLSQRQSQEVETEQSTVTVHYDQPRLVGSIGYERFAANDSRVDVSRFDLASSIVMANNQWGVSRPVTNGFIIVDTDSSLHSPEAIGVNPTRAGGFETNITSTLPAVITGVSPYYINRVYTDAAGTAYEYQSGIGQFNMITSYKSGRLAVLKGDNTVNVRGRLLTTDGLPIKLQVGDWVNQKSGEASMFFTNELGEFSLQNLAYGDYSIKLYQIKTSELTINLNNSMRKMNDLGDLVVSIKE